MLEINTTLYPYQMVLYRKLPVELKVKIKNTGTEKALVSYRMVLPSELSLDRTGFNSMHQEKIGELNPQETVEQSFDIFAKPLAREGRIEVLVHATEHYNSYEFTMKEYRKRVEIVIV